MSRHLPSHPVLDHGPTPEKPISRISRMRLCAAVVCLPAVLMACGGGGDGGAVEASSAPTTAASLADAVAPAASQPTGDPLPPPEAMVTAMAVVYEPQPPRTAADVPAETVPPVIDQPAPAP